jgi:hypothetical protein
MFTVCIIPLSLLYKRLSRFKFTKQVKGQLKFTTKACKTMAEKIAAPLVRVIDPESA